MKYPKIFTISALAFLIFNPLGVLAQERPIMLFTSDSKNPPVAGRNHTSVGYWDVDDFAGNRTRRSRFNIFKGFDGDIHIGSQSTCGETGNYMATLAIDPRNLSQITNLRLVSDFNSQELKDFAPNKYGNCRIFEVNSRDNYLVGWWDVDGGGGQGSDGSTGSGAMLMTAEFGNSASDRKLLDLQLIASDKKTPALKSGYRIVGFWDVDRGGSRGSDGSTGKYMMTLLAKWDK